MLETVRRAVYNLLGEDNSGHSNDHIDRVFDLSMKFAKEENANELIVGLIALLHDVDDYKLVSKEEADNLTNAKKILDMANVSQDIKQIVLGELSRIGYSNSLDGIRPLTKEGQIVSDADMCDASGVNGIIRSHKYNLKHGEGFFNKDVFPATYQNANEYKNSKSTTAVNHIFEKILKLKGLMLTQSGKKEASYRETIVIDMLYHLFSEENAPEWIEYLDNYLKDR